MPTSKESPPKKLTGWTHLIDGWGIGPAMQNLGRLIVVYGLWFISGGISLIIAYFLWQILIGLFFLKVDPWVLRSIRQFGLYVFGAMWLGFFIGSEAYIRKFIEPGKNIMRLLKILGIEIAVLITIYIVYLIIS
jgi:hypothetical protein